jgi:hypothetical protein
LDLLENLSDLGGDEVVEALEEPLAGRLIEDVPATPDSYRFSHALIRETLYHGLSTERRQQLHRRAGEALESLCGDDADDALPELAHHFLRAAPLGDADKAIGYSKRAGAWATGRVAYEEAANYYQQALDLIEGLGATGREALQCDLLISRGETERQAANTAYRQTLLDGARMADQFDHESLLVRAALANNRGFFSSAHGVDEERVAVLHSALRRCGSRDSADRARLLAHLAVELVFSGDWDARLMASDEAVAIARRLDDPETLAAVLLQRFVTIWGARTVTERLEISAEVRALAQSVGDPLLACYGGWMGCNAAIEAGDLALADSLMDSAQPLAEALGQPIIRWYADVTRAKRALVTDPPDDAEKLALAALTLGLGAGQPDALQWCVVQLLPIRSFQGRLGELVEVLEARRDSGVSLARHGSRSTRMLTRGIFLMCYAELGRTEEARGVFEEQMADDFSNLPYDYAWLASAALTAIACAPLGDTARAEVIHRLMEPHAGAFVDLGPSWLGSVDHYLGLLTATMGRFEDADDHFARAAEDEAGIGAEAWLARTRRARAEALASNA